MNYYCYSPMDAPDFFAGTSDCATVAHDFRLVGGDISGGNDLISAVLIQLNTDMQVNGERGWWGNQFMDFPLGNQLWAMIGKVRDNARIEAYINQSLDPLKSQGLFESFSVRTIQTIDGFEIVVDVYRDNLRLFSVVAS